MIRKFKSSDADTVIDVWYKSTSLAHPFMSEGFKKKEARLIRMVYIPKTETWVYEKNKKVIGFISMVKNEVVAFFLLPEYHGQGIGKKLLDTVAALHDELEVEVFAANKIGRNFYDKYGFKFLKKHLHKETGKYLLRLNFLKNV